MIEIEQGVPCSLPLRRYKLFHGRLYGKLLEYGQQPCKYCLHNNEANKIAEIMQVLLALRPPMSSSTRQRLTQAALELFLTQGVSQTTTRQIADKAGVNEATLFRNFGNKYGLFLAMLQESDAMTPVPQLLPAGESADDLRSYASECLQLLDQISSFVRSVIGEADQYPPEHRQALQQRLGTIKQDMAQHLDQLLGDRATRLPAEDMANLLGSLLLGYTVLETTSGYTLWADREAFLDTLVALLTGRLSAGAPAEIASPSTEFTTSTAGAVSGSEEITIEAAARVDAEGEGGEGEDGKDFQTSTCFQVIKPDGLIDLPAVWVHQMLKQARSLSAQDYALAYVLFGAGLLPQEVVRLTRSHQISDKSQHVLQILGGDVARQVPVNQWILGKRYGSYTSNPLTKWLKNRKDEAAAMFITAAGESVSLAEIQSRWQAWLQPIGVGDIHASANQARQTWCVEMLMRGISLENLSLLTGCDVADLQPFAQRAREKAAIAAATELDRKAASPSG